MEPVDKDRLWDEYKYRHKHCWDTLFKLTGAVVLISIIPYSQREVACVLSWSVVILPAVAIALGIFGYRRMQRELEVFEAIRAEHRKIQGLVAPSGGTFGKHVLLFLRLLIFAAILNVPLLLLSWRPAVVDGKQGPACFDKSTTEVGRKVAREIDSEWSRNELPVRTESRLSMSQTMRT